MAFPGITPCPPGYTSISGQCVKTSLLHGRGAPSSPPAPNRSKAENYADHLCRTEALMDVPVMAGSQKSRLIYVCRDGSRLYVSGAYVYRSDEHLKSVSGKIDPPPFTMMATGQRITEPAYLGTPVIQFHAFEDTAGSVQNPNDFVVNREWSAKCDYPLYKTPPPGYTFKVGRCPDGTNVCANKKWDQIRVPAGVSCG